jgi:regulator of sirC expression with transglutaminase-like and TPR domain
MDFSVTPPSPLEYFGALVQSDAQFPLLEAAISVGLEASPSVPLQEVQADCDQLLARLKRRLAPDASAMHRLRLLNQYFFEELGFSCTLNDFDDPDNCFIHSVLGNRRGDPIALALIWLELAQGLGLDVQGLALPGRFMVKVRLPHALVVMDMVSGRSQSPEDLSELLEPFGALHGDGAEDLHLFLQPTPPRGIIALLLRKLQDNYRVRLDWVSVIAVLNRLRVLLPDAADVYRDRGLAYAALGKATQAVQDLERYLSQAQPADDANVVSECLADLRRMT